MLAITKIINFFISIIFIFTKINYFDISVNYLLLILFFLLMFSQKIFMQHKTMPLLMQH